MIRRRTPATALLTALGAALAAVGGPLAAGGPVPAAAARPLSRSPLRVSSASVTQDGQQLVWRLVLTQPFSPGGLADSHQTVCLVLTQGARTVRLCAAGPRRGARQPRLIAYRQTAGGHGSAIPAEIERSSRRALTASFAPASVGLTDASLRWQVVSAVAAPGCASGRGSPGVPAPTCRLLSPAHPAVLRVHTPRVIGCVPSGPAMAFNGPSRSREVALTFDDGPSDAPPSAEFVKLLAAEGVPATFFEIGEQIGEYDPTGAVERAMLADGDMIGDHTWSHPDLVGLSPAAQRQQITRTAGAIKRVTGFAPCLFRAPYGAVDRSLVALVRSLGMTTIGWNVDPRDWALPGVRSIEHTVITTTRGGSIILQHFGGGPRYETLHALPAEIAALRARGYRFVTVTQLLGYRLLYG